MFVIDYEKIESGMKNFNKQIEEMLNWWNDRNEYMNFFLSTWELKVFKVCWLGIQAGI